MANVLTSISGTMLVPGVSRNRRLYTPALIDKAVSRMQGRIADPHGLPIVMRTHHDAGDNSALIVGRVTDVHVDETGAARYQADLYDTSAGRDIAAITTGPKPALRSTSIHGYFLGPVKRIEEDGETVETADDLEVDAIDFTATPGVAGAVLDLGSSRTQESVAERTAIQESWDPATVVEAKDPSKPYGNVQYADPGYQADKRKRYPLDTEDHIRAAWSYINQADNAAQYTPKQLARVKGRIKAAMKRIGAKVSDETATRFGEVREYVQGPGGAGFCLDAYNGPISVTVRSCDIDPAGLRVVTTAAMKAAIDALQALDPDMDADIDLPDDPGDDTDAQHGETTSPPAGVPAQEAAPAPHATPATGDSTHNEEVPAVSEAQTTAESTATTPTGRTLSDDDIQALGAMFGTVIESALSKRPAVTETNAPIAPTSEPATSPTTETTPKVKSGKKALKETVAKTVQEALAQQQAAFEQKLQEALTAQKDELREQVLAETGGPGRKGFRVHESDTSTGDDLWNRRREVWSQVAPAIAPIVADAPAQ